MTELPQIIKEIFFQTLKGDISIDDFEKWVYENKKLDKLLKPDDYLDLITLNYQKNGAKNELWKLLKKHIDFGEYQTYVLLELLQQAKKKTSRLPYILMDFYELYCNDYEFLQELGLGYGLCIKVPCIKNSTTEYWEDLTQQEQREILERFSPKLEKEIDRVIEWLISRKIILTGEQDEIENCSYKDFRTKEEKK